MDPERCQQRKDWHRLSAEGVLEVLETSRDGLSPAEAERRLGECGYNEIPREKRRGPAFYLWRQVRQPLVYVLIIAVLVTSYLEEWLDAVFISAVVLANILIGFFQEYKADEAINELIKHETPVAVVRRDGEPDEVSSKVLVPGDIVLLQSGDKVPADVRILYGKDLAVDESLLTGESQSVSKDSESVDADPSVPADLGNVAFSGTFVVRGKGEGVVIRTGPWTEISKISQQISSVEEESFPLMRKIAGLSKQITALIVVVASVSVVIGLLQGYELVYMFRASVAIAVGAIPEGLPALLTVVMAFGVRSMARRNALIRRLPAVEALGSTTVICSDKTGTLTLNHMTVSEVFAGGNAHASDSWPNGGDADVLDTLRAVGTCNDASVTGEEEIGDPTEVALVEAAQEAGVYERRARLDEIAFDSRTEYMATLHRADRENIVFVKGSPEKVIGRCTRVQVDGREMGIDREEMLSASNRMAGQGLRVLAAARKAVPGEKTAIDESDIDGLTLLGLVGLRDPPRKEVRAAIEACRTAEIRVIMITGDHADTAAAIARELDIMGPGDRVVTGRDIEASDDDAFREMVSDTKVFARASPEHKLRIVRELRRRGEVVALTGDGVNDTPALRAADIGVSMGRGGTDAAKAAADMVLEDDNFATIVAAVEEGRNVYLKLTKILSWILPTSINEATVIFIALLMGITLPFTPVQVLWVNLVTAISLAVPLVLEPREKGLLNRPPRDPAEPIINSTVFRKLVVASAVMIVGTFLVFDRYLSVDGDVELARTAALNTLIFFEMFYLVSSHSLDRSSISIETFANRWMYVGIGICFFSQLLITYSSGMNDVLGTSPLSPVDWLVAAGVGSTILAAIELEKFVMRRRSSVGGSP